MMLLTVAFRLDTDVPKPASVVLNPLKLEVTVLRDVERALRYELKPVTWPIETAVYLTNSRSDGKVVRTCASVKRAGAWSNLPGFDPARQPVPAIERRNVKSGGRRRQPTAPGSPKARHCRSLPTYCRVPVNYPSFPRST